MNLTKYMEARVKDVRGLWRRRAGREGTPQALRPLRPVPGQVCVSMRATMIHSEGITTLMALDKFNKRACDTVAVAVGVFASSSPASRSVQHTHATPQRHSRRVGSKSLLAVALPHSRTRRRPSCRAPPEPVSQSNHARHRGIWIKRCSWHKVRLYAVLNV